MEQMASATAVELRVWRVNPGLSYVNSVRRRIYIQEWRTIQNRRKRREEEVRRIEEQEEEKKNGKESIFISQYQSSVQFWSLF